MKSLIIGLVLFLVSSAASAAWCRAESPYGWGEGAAYTVQEACAIALNECAMRTPAGAVCVVVAY